MTAISTSAPDSTQLPRNENRSIRLSSSLRDSFPVVPIQPYVSPSFCVFMVMTKF